MRTAMVLVAGLLVGCGARAPLANSDGGRGDAPVNTTDAGTDGSVRDGAPLDGGPVFDAPANDGSTGDGGGQHDARQHDARQQDGGSLDGPGLTPCELAGDTCVPLYPGSCSGTVVGLSCGPGLGLECCRFGDGGTCWPSGGCANGPLCGATCCNSGERCDSATTTCRCGTNAACSGGDICASGPISVDRCGTICCGVSGPCPG